MSLTFGLANTVEVLVAALLINGSAGHKFDRRTDLSFSRSLGRFVICGVFFAPLVSGATVWICERLLGHHPGFVGIRDWYLGDMIGISIMTPLLLAIKGQELVKLLDAGRLHETLFLLIGTFLVSVFVFRQNHFPFEFSLFPALLVLLFRLGTSGGALGTVLMAGPGAYFTELARGPFAPVAGGSMSYSIRLFQLFLCFLSATVYFVGSALAERQRLQSALTAANLELKQIAAFDPLTRLPNRRTMDERLDEEWRRATRHKTCVSLLMVDVDNFKIYNDRYGHLAGDLVLKAVAGVLGEIAQRASDFAARYGGEEFVIVLPATDSTRAIIIAERLRQKVAGLQRFDENGALPPVTISIGIATIWPLKESSPTLLIEGADRALYAAKNAGRNRICVWPLASSDEGI
jgi:diguanylate cyclase (GGDEF)-like protein